MSNRFEIIVRWESDTETYLYADTPHAARSIFNSYLDDPCVDSIIVRDNQKSPGIFLQYHFHGAYEGDHDK